MADECTAGRVILNSRVDLVHNFPSFEKETNFSVTHGLISRANKPTIELNLQMGGKWSLALITKFEFQFTLYCFLVMRNTFTFLTLQSFTRWTI